MIRIWPVGKPNYMSSIDFFVAAEKYFAKMVENIQNPVIKENHLDIIEDELLRETRELARLLLQGHIDSRGDGEIGAMVISSSKVELSSRRKTSRILKTLFGQVKIIRVSYSHEGHRSLFPLDA